ncbi:hypothetical protein KFE25_001715 [Diacronema lutheri]|uniref:Uncharacterized protein n=1 Tax=Diacronema lutheri TaxID=2081491 RepID=A0A8J5XFK5_DIALT|nr:hypothetical protein KFE25_001715 [Diacronema lutheri]
MGVEPNDGLHRLGASLERWQAALRGMDARLAAVEQAERELYRTSARAVLEHDLAAGAMHMSVPPHTPYACGVAAHLAGLYAVPRVQSGAPALAARHETQLAHATPPPYATPGTPARAASPRPRTTCTPFQQSSAPAPLPQPDAGGDGEHSAYGCWDAPATRPTRVRAAPAADARAPVRAASAPRSSARPHGRAADLNYVVPEALTPRGTASTSARRARASANDAAAAGAAARPPPRAHHWSLSTAEFRELNRIRSGELGAGSAPRRAPSPPSAQPPQRGARAHATGAGTGGARGAVRVTPRSPVRFPSLLLSGPEVELVETWRALHAEAAGTSAPTPAANDVERARALELAFGMSAAWRGGGQSKSGALGAGSGGVGEEGADGGETDEEEQVRAVAHALSLERAQRDAQSAHAHAAQHAAWLRGAACAQRAQPCDARGHTATERAGCENAECAPSPGAGGAFHTPASACACAGQPAVGRRAVLSDSGVTHTTVTQMAGGDMAAAFAPARAAHSFVEVESARRAAAAAMAIRSVSIARPAA